MMVCAPEHKVAAVRCGALPPVWAFNGELTVNPPSIDRDIAASLRCVASRLAARSGGQADWALCLTRGRLALTGA